MVMVASTLNFAGESSENITTAGYETSAQSTDDSGRLVRGPGDEKNNNFRRPFRSLAASTCVGVFVSGQLFL